MSDDELISKTASFIQEKFKAEGSGHDWFHIARVWRLSKHIAQNEKQADLLTVELGALLHDIADWKFHDGDMEAGSKASRKWLEGIQVSDDVIKKVEDIVRSISFKAEGEKLELPSLESRIVFDADKIDAIGAIGIARAFAFGGHKGRLLYDPNVKPIKNMTFEQRLKSETHTINHFYEKLLLLKDLMQTETGKQMAERRHKFMEKFLEEFYSEWEGKI